MLDKFGAGAHPTVKKTHAAPANELVARLTTWCCSNLLIVEIKREPAYVMAAPMVAKDFCYL